MNRNVKLAATGSVAIMMNCVVDKRRMYDVVFVGQCRRRHVRRQALVLMLHRRLSTVINADHRLRLPTENGRFAYAFSRLFLDVRGWYAVLICSVFILKFYSISHLFCL